MNVLAYIVCLCALTIWGASAAAVSRVHCGVIIDAGSSGSRVKVYNWTAGVEPTNVPTVELMYSEDFEPGISSYYNDSVGLRNHLNDLVEAAKAHVPVDSQAETPIVVMATAGLRLLELQEASLLMEEIRGILSDASFNPFYYDPKLIQIISGEEEGVYAWISLNYLLNFFGNNRPVTESYGVLEMGGGSTQIAFVPRDPLLSEEFHVTVAETQYSLYVQSYLQYGMNAIVEKEAYELIRYLPPVNDSAVDVGDHCRLEGDNKNVTVKGFNGEPDKPVTLIGTSSPVKCKLILEQILLKSNEGYDCIPGPCAIGSVYQPHVYDMPFYAIAGFVHAPLALGVISADNASEPLDRRALEKSAKAYCKQTLQEAIDAGQSAKYASNNCLMGLYFNELLDTYGFDRANAGQVLVTSQIAGKDVDWTLGAMFQILSSTFSKDPDHFQVKRRRR